jgi:hypothetical protein
MIAFLLFAILAVIFWSIKAAAATGIGAKMLHDRVRDSQPRPGHD